MKIMKGKMQQPCFMCYAGRVALLLGWLCIPNTGAAWEFDPKQLAMLPPYCRYTQLYRDAVPGANNAAEIERWSQVLGKRNFSHLHHYCWGIENTNRALYSKTRKDSRDFLLDSAIQEFDYVIRLAPPDHVLLPEILTKKAENLIRLDRTLEAINVLERAIELRPDYWPPYALMGDHYRQLGELSLARTWLEKGLEAVPDAKPLSRRLAALRAESGGKRQQ